MTGCSTLRYVAACRATVLLFSLASHVWADGNFTGADPEVLTAAEQARVASAMFWTGHELPGRWTVPCPVNVQPAVHDGGGTTTFLFDRGEVSGWEMTVTGRRERILADVIPHEVDHMVRASLVRRPIPRWLDEGCAALMESPESHQRLRRELQSCGPITITDAFLDADRYPLDGRQLSQLYAVGFSLTEYLLQRRNADTLLAFQRDARPPSQKLTAFYGLSQTELNLDWTAWRHRRGNSCDCRSAQCPRHQPRALADGQLPNPNTSSPHESLTIFTSEWCGPCRRFWNDWRQHPSLRRQLETQFRIHVVDIDRQPLIARQQHIDCVPAFVTTAGILTGYEGPDWLLTRLALPIGTPVNGLAASAPTSTPTDSFAPALPPSGTEPTSLPLPNAPAAPTSQLVPHSLPLPASSSVSRDKNGGSTSRLLTHGWEWTWGVVTHLWPWLQLAGLVGGSAATGGVATLVVGLLWRIWKRRRTRRHSPNRSGLDPQGGWADRPAPFPRQLDEARELLELRQSEGRVAVLDALRGMFLDDEIQKSLTANDPATAAPLKSLLTAIDTRVNEVAPLAVDIQE
ncbi:MAG: thioredoxin domain-containing protein [Planctomycetaceae bacterium]